MDDSFGWGGGVGERIVASRTQSLWLHLYLGYFCVGMVLNEMERVKVISIKAQIIVSAGINVCCAIIYAWNVKRAEMFYFPHQYYGKWFYTVWLVSLFWLVSRISIKNMKMQQVIKMLAANTFVVYLGHLPILLFVTLYYPIQNIGMAILFVIAFFFGLEMLAELFKRLPLLRKLV